MALNGTILLTKNDAQLESCKLKFCVFFFNLWHTEDCSPGDSTSDSSERLLQRGTGKGEYIRFW